MKKISVKVPINGEKLRKKLNIQDGLPGRDGLDGTNGVDGQNGKDGAPDTGEQIVEKINASEGQIDRERVKGLDELEKRIDTKINAIPRGGGGGNKGVRFYPLTADGVTKIFTVPKSVVSKISMSDFPYVLFQNSGFSINTTRTQITITTDNAPSAGSQLLYEYQQMFG